MKLVSLPTVNVPAWTIFPPNQSIPIILANTTSCIIGIFKTTIPNAPSEACNNSSLLFLNFSFSLFLLTKDLTTLIPIKFSWTVVFKLSIFFCIDSNLGLTFFIINPIEIIRTGIDTKNIIANLGLIVTAKMHATISIIGALTKSLIPIVKAFCIIVISVVNLVINDAVLNFSIFLNE